MVEPSAIASSAASTLVLVNTSVRAVSLVAYLQTHTPHIALITRPSINEGGVQKRAAGA